MSAQHTPGPWHTEGFGDQSTVGDAHGLGPLAVNLSAANARLIAAAPELLAALKALYARACSTEPDHQGLRHKSLSDAFYAIAKATEGQS